MSAVSSVKSFLYQKFWRPVIDESVHYNPFNTAAYSVLFAVAAAYLGKPLLEKLNVDLDREFFLSISPYIFLGGAARSLKDVEIVNTVLLETPFIYILFFGVVTSALYASRKMEEFYDFKYHKVFGSIGAAMLLGALSLYSFSSPLAFAEVGLIFVPVAALVYYVTREFTALDLHAFSLPVSAHFFDASTSVVAISHGATEKHVLANHFINLMGLSGMFVMKTLIVAPATYYICTEMEGRDRNYYLFLIALLGLALGTRNLISTAA